MTQPNRLHPAFRLESRESRALLELTFADAALLDDGSGTSRVAAHVIPQAGVPRWVLPDDTSRALPVLKSWKPYSVKSFVQWKGILAACKLHLLPAVPGTLRATLSCDSSYWRRSIPGFTDRWEMVVYIGHPSPTRKAVVFFVDEHAQVKAVTKLPIEEAAKAAILNEAEILASLAGRMPLPAVLFSDREEGVAGQTWVSGMHVASRFGAEQLALLSCLADEGAEVRLSDTRDALKAALQNLDLTLDRTLLQKALSLLESGTALRAFTEHRDFTPWNIRRLSGGQLTLIDWEWAIAKGLPWQDACRYFYLQDFLFKQGTNVWETLTQHPLLNQYRLRFALSLASVRGLTMHYLLRSLCEDHAEGNRERAAYVERKIREVLS